ncbi:MAG: M24 family metallopeptidase [Hyphomicrobiales bacterium]
MTVSLKEIDWPDFGMPEPPQGPDLAELRERLAAARAAMTRHGLDVLVVYGDREHCANLHWLTDFDPRFEEALLILTATEAVLAAGNECLPYTELSPLVASGDIRVVHCASLSLVSQPRGGLRFDRLVADTIPMGAIVGTIGWKYWTEGEVADPAAAIEIPAIIVDLLRERAKQVRNATALFMNPADGLRATVSVAEIVRMEFANQQAAAALRRMAFSLREGISDFDAVEAARVGGLPLGCHITFATGRRAWQGLSSASGERLERGSPIAFNICHWRSNICRAGWVASSADDLPAAARSYVEAFAGPYLAALSDWFAQMRPGVSGGAVWAKTMTALPVERFGITLNPGHLIGIDEWISSPIFEGSDIPLQSGMAMQCDIIPAHPVFGSTRMEDGYVITDATLRAELAARHPTLLRRATARRDFMRAVIGLSVPDDLLPLADTCGIIAPFLLAPRQVLVLGA